MDLTKEFNRSIADCPNEAVELKDYLEMVKSALPPSADIPGFDTALMGYPGKIS